NRDRHHGRGTLQGRATDAELLPPGPRTLLIYSGRAGLIAAYAGRRSMLSYLLNMPRERWERPDRPRRVVRVSIAADGADAFARLAFEGEGKDVAAVREALFNRATGVQGATLEEKTTPRHLAVAMDGPAMQPFAPALLTGDALFRPAGAASAEALSRL